MGKNDSFTLECNGKAARKSYPLNFKSEINDILKLFPDKVIVDLPIVGKTDFAVKPYVKSLLENVPIPTLKLRFKVKGNCKDFAAITIENTFKEVLDSGGGTFQVLGIGINYTFEAEVDDDDDAVVVKCKDGAKDGKQWTRTFHIEWYLDVNMNPGLSGKYLIDEFDITISACCCTNVTDEDEDDGGCFDQQDKKPPSKKKSPGGKYQKGGMVIG